MQRREFYKIFGSIQRRDFSCLEERNVSLFWKVIFSWLWEVIFPYRHDPQNFREISWLATRKTLNLLSSLHSKLDQRNQTKHNFIDLVILCQAKRRCKMNRRKGDTVYILSVWFYFIFGDELYRCHIIFSVQFKFPFIFFPAQVRRPKTFL